MRLKFHYLRFLIFVVMIQLLFLFSGCGGSGGAIGSSNGQPIAPKTVTPQAKWDFLVYLDGDNNLESDAIFNFAQMEQIGSTNDVNILVLFDRIPGYDDSHGNWTNTRLYRVTKNTSAYKLQFVSTYLKDLGEADMSNPQTLTDFITYCHTWFPADHVMLTLWDHGGGVYPRSLTSGSAPSIFSKGIAWDDTTGTGVWNCLTTDQVGQALANARSVTNQKIDIINTDACLMELLEVAYQWRNETDYLVGSEETVPGKGNNYQTILSDLTSHPGISAHDYATKLVDEYYRYYSTNPSFGTDTTYSAIDLGQMDPFLQDFKDFALKLNSAPTGLLGNIKTARTASTSFDYPELVDLYDFTVHLQVSIPGSDLATAATTLQSSISSLVIGNRDTGIYQTSHPAHGLGILFPASQSQWQSYSASNRYPMLALALDTDWDNFIIRYTGYTN